MESKTILKNYQKFNNLPFHIERFAPTEPIQLHYHDCVELILCTDNTALNHIEDTCFEFGKGSLFIIGKHPAHSMSDFNGFNGYRILFDMALLDTLDEEVKDTPGYMAMFLANSSGYMFPVYLCCLGMAGTYYTRAVSIMEDLLYEYENETILSEKYITALFQTLCVLIVKCHRANRKEERRKFYTRAVNMMYRHIGERITVDDIAKKLGISKRQFEMRFKEESGGFAPAQYFTELRLRIVKSLLSCSDKSITEIAVSCGFYDNSHLTRVFKQNEGVTPKEYRKRTRV